jgi:N-acetylglutamate synthase-like GNAT family acetyltransferase
MLCPRGPAVKSAARRLPPLVKMAPMPFKAQPAHAHDLAPARDLLRRADLPDEGVADHFGNYLVVRDASRLVGICGIEVHGESGLLRSVAVDPDYRGEGIGGLLVAGAQELARKLRVEDVYLLTTSAADFFRRHGFQDCPREKAPEPVRASWEFRSGCPASAALMKWPARAQARGG